MADTQARIKRGLPLVFDFPVECPAGQQIAMGKGGSSGCHCTVERSDILAAENPGSLMHYCLSRSGYRACPTWQSEKERIAEARRTPLVAAGRGEDVAPGRTKVSGA